MTDSALAPGRWKRAACFLTLWCIGGATPAHVARGENTVPAAEIPAAFVGAWQLRIDGRTFRLKAQYNIEIKMTDGRDGAPEALVSYFAGDEKRPSTICRSQLTLVSSDGRTWIFAESLNFKNEGGKDLCPIWGQLAVAANGEQLWLQWRDGRRSKAVVKMEGNAQRSTGGMECRTVGGSGQSGGQVFCRTPDGDWVPRVL